jgi:hypothetical protein
MKAFDERVAKGNRYSSTIINGLIFWLLVAVVVAGIGAVGWTDILGGF